MIPAAIAGLKAASPLVKAGVIAGTILALYLSYLGWKEYQQYIGREEERTKQQAELTRQNQESLQEYVRQVAILRQQVDDVNEEKEAFREKLASANQEIQRYAKLHQVRRIDNDAIAIVNEFARVLNDATEERVPAAGGTAAEPAVAATAAPTTLDAFERLEALTERLGDCELKHRGLSEWAIERYQSELAFYERPP